MIAENSNAAIGSCFPAVKRKKKKKQVKLNWIACLLEYVRLHTHSHTLSTTYLSKQLNLTRNN